MRAAKARNLVILEESSDKCIKGAKIEVDGGIKADTPKEVEEAKSRLRTKEITGIADSTTAAVVIRKQNDIWSLRK